MEFISARGNVHMWYNILWHGLIT